MKKLITMMASISVVSFTSSVVVACANGPIVELNYQNGNDSHLSKLLSITKESLNDIKTAKALYDAIEVKVKDLDETKQIGESDLYEKTQYSITLKDKTGATISTRKDEDFGKTGERMFIVVNYSKTLNRKESDKFSVIETVESDIASFAIINRD
ncbi:hypothetical protein SCHIN_v1c05030 [Spiroplasma chinense]|uniref:Lipoprotein n=1 Tax=Spiroplasma chinense TaxID=216932 RepID=A0A5B9Y414_9MOLU|nr:hypothetical protein [Spiroplasma chinense]QEH61700.1 hypothetical protein SCHIN_v1c05030 [Spiroplasma chinense]